MKKKIVISLLVILVLLSVPATAEYFTFPGSPLGRAIQTLLTGGVSVETSNANPLITDTIEIKLTDPGRLHAVYKHPFLEKYGWLDDVVTNEFAGQNDDYTLLGSDPAVLESVAQSYPEHAENPEVISSIHGSIDLSKVEGLVPGTYRLAVVMREGVGGTWREPQYHYTKITVKAIAEPQCEGVEEQCEGSNLQVCSEGQWTDKKIDYNECKGKVLHQCENGVLVTEECLLCMNGQCFAQVQEKEPAEDLPVEEVETEGALGEADATPRRRPTTTVAARPACVDTDGGATFNDRGKVRIANVAFVDHCGVDPGEKGKLIEFACDENNEVERIVQTCKFQCRNGKCLQQVSVAGKAVRTCAAAGGFIDRKGNCILQRSPNFGRDCGCGSKTKIDGECAFE